MSTSPSTMAYLLDQLTGAGPITSRRMFGEYCLYYAGRPVGLVCDEQLFLKPTERGRALMRDPAEGAPFPGARPHLRLSADDWEDRQLLARLVRTTFEELPAPKLPKAKTADGVSPGKAGGGGRAGKVAKSAKPAKAGSAAEGEKAGKAASPPIALSALPNLGPRSMEMLKAAGIHTLTDLQKLGSVAAYVQVQRNTPRASLNLLWALEGALSDLPWQVVAREHRTSLLLALEQATSKATTKRLAPR